MIGNIILENVKEYKYLGITFTKLNIFRITKTKLVYQNYWYVLDYVSVNVVYKFLTFTRNPFADCLSTFITVIVNWIR